MAWLTVPRSSRRGFLLTAAGLALRGQQGARWALLADTHVAENMQDASRGFQPYENLKQVVPAVAGGGFAGAVICGDLARLTGLPGDYANFRQLLEPVTRKMPVAMALGNHDHRQNFLAALGPAKGAQRAGNKHVVLVESGGFRLIVLDSLLETNVTPGQLGSRQRAWLEEHLATADPAPTLVFVHHTLNGEDGGLVDVERLLGIVKGYRGVKAVLYGHSHAYKFEVWNGIHLINLPAVGYNFNDREPVGWVDAHLAPNGGEFTLRAIGGNRAQDGQAVSLAWRG
jgi:3',5'-cyclic AMP phosphodiesterase CpdA